MEIKKIVSGVLHNNTYVVTSGNDAIIIDANASYDMLKPYLEGKTVVLLSGSGYKKNDFTLVDRFCREADVKSPETLIK